MKVFRIGNKKILCYFLTFCSEGEGFLREGGVVWTMYYLALGNELFHLMTIQGLESNNKSPWRQLDFVL